MDMNAMNSVTNGENGFISRLAELILSNPPAAFADIRGSEAYPDIEGSVVFYSEPQGVLVLTAVLGI